MIFIKMTVGILKNNPNTVNFEKNIPKRENEFCVLYYKTGANSVT